MAKTKAVKLQNSHGSVFSSSGYKGVMRMGSKFGYRYESASGSFSKGGFDTADEAAYHYDEFLVAHLGEENAITNQILGLLKPKTVLAIREKLTVKDRPTTKLSKTLKSKTGFKGVIANRNKNSNKFSANCYAHGKVIYIGSYSTAEEAARAYDAFALKHVGPSAETNVKLGLIPPIVDPVFQPDLSKRPYISKQNQPNPEPEKPASINKASWQNSDHGHEEDDDSQPAFNTVTPPPACAAYSSPEDERQRQIAAARQMAEIEEEEEPEDKPAPQLAIKPESQQPSQEEKPAEVPLENAPAVKSSSVSGELLRIADRSPDDLRKEAEVLLRAAAEAESKQIKNEMLNIIEGLSHSMIGIQDTMMKLIDRASEMEQAIARLKAML